MGTTTPTLVFEGANTEGLLPESGCEFPASTGLHLIVGKNNSGKSRLLKALAGASMRTHLSELPLPNIPNVNNIVAQAGLAAPMKVAVTRSLVAHLGDGPSEVHLGNECYASHALNQQFSNAGHARTGLINNIKKQVPFRRSHVVPTNRIFSEQAQLVDRAPLPFEPKQWPPDLWVSLLEALRGNKDDAPRAAFKEIAEHFSIITEGLTFSLDGALTRTLNILEGTSRRSIADCGDGLRDILGILIYVVLAPDYDIFIEEPGIRLHPGAQKRLLDFLEKSASRRAIWATSHDSPYVFARGVVSRFITAKTSEQKIAVYRSSSAEEHRSCLRDLGWEPAMAAIADAVIYCEGPSDKIAFEGALVDGARRVVAFPLGGSSAVTDDKQWDKLILRIKSTAQLLPHLTQKVILDEDGEPEKRKKLCDRLAKAGIDATFLPKKMLEAYWVGDEFTKVVDEMVKEAAQRSGVNARNMRVDEAVQRASVEAHEKRRLQTAVEAVLPAGFNELAAAEAALRVAPASIRALIQDLHTLMGWT